MWGRILTQQVTGTSFVFYTDEEIRKLSVKRITNPQTFDSYGRPTPNGVYDPALGPVDFVSVCPTCGLKFSECPGHCGHIELSVPVYNPTMFTLLHKILRLKCFSCHSLRIAAARSRMLKVQLMLIDVGRWHEAMELDMTMKHFVHHALKSHSLTKDEESRAKLAGKRGGMSAEEVEIRLAAEDEFLKGYEIDCLAAGGSDVGCGFGDHSSNASSTESSGVHHKYSQHVRECREKLIATYLADFPSKACHNCGALPVAIKKDGYAKLFTKPLSKKDAAAMAAAGISYRSATSTLRSRARKGAQSDDDTDYVTADDDRADVDDVGRQRYIPASEVAAHFQLLWEHDHEILRRIFMPKKGPKHRIPSKAHAAAVSDGWKSFFLRVIAVPPARFRPPQVLGEAQYEHSQNIYLTKIIRCSDLLIELGLGAASEEEAAAKSFGGVDMKKAIAAWMDLQNNVNGLMDSSKATSNKGATLPNGIRQLLEKKEGMFRKNMMGKRVNFAARSVISPDPYLRADQVGVPVRFAQVLTFKQPVTSFNVKLMRQLVINGPFQWPGATHIENEDGTLIDLSTRDKAQREALAKTLMTPSTNFAMSRVLTGGVGAPEYDIHASIAAATSGAPGGMGVKRVYRHLQDDDILLMNRQPTLHKPSIMAHRARVMRHWSSQQTIRFHYANCKTYNADFDGDEMNMHLPQDEISRAEAYTIVATPYQYLAPTSGAPLRGLIQDHNSVSVILTKRDAFLTKDQYCQLVFSALQALPQYGYGNGVSGGDGAFGIDTASAAGSQDVVLLPPTILKPRPLWTGKQVFSTILHALSSHLPPQARHLYLDAKSKISDGLWAEAANRKDTIGVGDSAITIRGNDMLTGVIDKNSLGNSSHGLVHAVFETYGPHAAGALLSATGRLLTVYLQWAAVTCGMDDLVLTSTVERSRAGLIKQALDAGAVASAHFAGMVSAEVGKGVTTQPEWVAEVRRAIRAKLKGGAAGSDATGAAAADAINQLDGMLKSSVAQVHSKLLDACLPFGLYKPFPYNQFSLMVASGAKGSGINHAMIAVGLGQQELEGKRVPMMTSGKTLPCFPSYDPSPRAGGYISDRFLTGLRPADYYFHCMSGREGLVDTAVKTSRSGYLQRCLIKHLETLRVHYDYSVRDSDGALIQTCYGEDGIDTMQTAYLSGADDKMTFLARNSQALLQQYGVGSEAFQAASRSLNIEETQSIVQDMLDKKAAFQSSALPAGSKASGSAVGVLPLKNALALHIHKEDRAEIRLPAKWNMDCVKDAGQLSQQVLKAVFSKGKATGLPADNTALTHDVTVDGRKYAHLAHFIASDGAVSSRFKPCRVTKVRHDDEGKIENVDVHFYLGFTPESNELQVCHTLSITIRKLPVAVSLLDAEDDANSTPSLLMVKPDIPDPLLNSVNPATHLGAMGESLLHKLVKYTESNPHKALRSSAPGKASAAAPSAAQLSAAAFNILLGVKAQRALVHPGEPVGVLAGQGVGEPSTQMTLNTFHLAGGGGVNVTLGIPRLREIVMTASANIKTPAMTLVLRKEVVKAGNDTATAVANRIARQLSQLPLADLLAVDRSDGGINVVESLKPLYGHADASRSQWIREYCVRLHFTDLAAIKAAFGIDFESLASTVASVFAPKLFHIIEADLRKAARAVAGATVSAAVKEGDAIDADGDDDVDDDRVPTKRVAAKSAGNKKASKSVAKDGAAAANINNEDDDDEEDDDDDDDDNDAAAADKGTLRLGRRKQVSGYDDIDEEKEEEEGDVNDDDAASTTSSSSSGSSNSSSSTDSSSGSDDDDSSDEDSVSNSDAGVKTAAAKSAKPKEKRTRITRKAVESHVSGVKLSADVFKVDVPDVLARNRRFGGMLACRSGAVDDKTGADNRVTTTDSDRTDPWVQVTVVFPASARKVLMLASAERAAAAALVSSTPGITRAMVANARLGGAGSEEQAVIHTEGVNFAAVWRLASSFHAEKGDGGLAEGTPIIDVNRIISNDIAGILKAYGVEAARAAIVREMRNVFDAYHINVDIRHLFLIADYMTHGGKFRAMNRAGMEAHGSPYLKMSFETTMGFLTKALLNAETDRMTSASARIVMGRIVDSGTGAFDLWTPA